jgi:hypothetical protein
MGVFFNKTFYYLTDVHDTKNFFNFRHLICISALCFFLKARSQAWIWHWLAEPGIEGSTPPGPIFSFSLTIVGIYFMEFEIGLG